MKRNNTFKGILLLSFSLWLGVLNAQIFSSAQSISGCNNPQVVKSADFNNDGYMDMVYSSIGDHKIALALFNGVQKM